MVDKVSVYNCSFEGNLASSGGAVAIYSANYMAFELCNFSLNVAMNNGGVLYGVSAESIVFDSCQFDSNSAGESGGAINAVGYINITQSMFFNHSAGLNGGAIALILESFLQINGTDFYSNEATYAGALYVDGESNVNLYDVTFYDNKASESAGALFCEGSVYIDSCDFSFNVAGSNGGAFVTIPI